MRKRSPAFFSLLLFSPVRKRGVFAEEAPLALE